MINCKYLKTKVNKSPRTKTKMLKRKRACVDADDLNGPDDGILHKACKQCRAAHKKCNKKRPCSRCLQKGLKCENYVKPPKTKKIRKVKTTRIPVEQSLIDRLFGGTNVDINPQGSIDLQLGARYSNSEDPNRQIAQQRKHNSRVRQSRDQTCKRTVCESAHTRNMQWARLRLIT